jgi:hypothetical protein
MLDQLKAAAGDTPLPFDPSQLNPDAINKFSQAMRRLPKGQVQRLQSLMQKAMAGKDVSREAMELESQLPPDFQEMLKSFGPMGLGGADLNASQTESGMSEQDARRIIEEAAKSGKISSEQAKELLASQDGHSANPEEGSKLSKMWNSLRGKKA